VFQSYVCSSFRRLIFVSCCQVLYILTTATVGAYGWYQPHFWAAITGETKVSKIEGTEPWKDGAEGSTGKYRYHARATPGKEARVKDAPSALNTVIVPNVNLPRVSWSKPLKASVSILLTSLTEPSREVQQMGQGRIR
jgi:hypothetical protein